MRKLQEENGFAEMQSAIESGRAWSLEGSVGREAMSLLRSGACFLPNKARFDYYGNRIPKRDELKSGTTGTKLNSQRFWAKVESGEALIW